MTEFKPLQIESELKAFIELVRREKVSSYLEIGCKYGGSLWRIANALPVGSKIVAVDLSNNNTQPALQHCAANLKQAGYDIDLILGNSTDPNIVRRVARSSPFDLCMIDANHTEPFVRADWKNYGPMSRLVAFHDVNHTAHIGTGRLPIEVKKIWDEIKQNHRHVEIKHHPNTNGIGVLWH